MDRSPAGLRAAVCPDDPDIPLRDGPPGPADPPTGLPIHSGGRGHRVQWAGTVPARLDSSPGAAATSVSGPRFHGASRSWRRLPPGVGAPWRSGGPDRGAAGVEHDRYPKREAAPETPGRPMADPAGRDPALDAKRPEGANFLRPGRQPREVGGRSSTQSSESGRRMSTVGEAIRDPRSGDVGCPRCLAHDGIAG